MLQQTPPALVAEPQFMFCRWEELLLDEDVEMFFILFSGWGCPKVPEAVRRAAELGCLGDVPRLARVSADHGQCQC